ncbi:spermidine synthase [Actinomyces sp. oral taxon 170]|uniref:spermidine synthase n=1 Tax=Actinomyces sp. oral taxon 170 TaxID=712117 RepID=UPI0002FEF3AC|nr:fused MFS/spermidine synthase [Actinomyces sp. oral taxon 170]
MTRKRRTSSAPGLADLPSGPVRTSFATAELVARDSGVLLILDGAESSFLDLHDPTHLDFEYHQQMDAVLTALRGEGGPVRALHLGGAGCALARAWDARRPGSQQLAVEIDEILAARVRVWFDLPRSPRLRIRVGDAAEVVGELRPGQWDVIVRDVFNGGSVPATCRNRAFLSSCLEALVPGGLLLVNTSSTPRTQAGAEIEALTQALEGDASGLAIVADPATMRGRRRGNLVLVARREPFAAAELEEIERAVRRLPLPVRTWSPGDAAVPHPEGGSSR